MDNDMRESIQKLLDKKEINPAVKNISAELTVASDELIHLLGIIRGSDKKIGLSSLSTVMSGLALVLTDNVDEALGALKKAREQIIQTEKEVNKEC